VDPNELEKKIEARSQKRRKNWEEEEVEEKDAFRQSDDGQWNNKRVQERQCAGVEIGPNNDARGQKGQPQEKKAPRRWKRDPSQNIWSPGN